MDIFPQILGETEFMFFGERDYKALSNVLDEVLAGYILEYVNNASANASVKESILANLSDRIRELTFHVQLKGSGIIDLVKVLSPESLSTCIGSLDLDVIIDKLEFLESNADKIRTTIPARTSLDYKSFVSSIGTVLARIAAAGVKPTYPDIMARIKANKFVFYVTGEKDYNTGVGILINRRRQWTITLNGARYLKHCEKNKISAVERNKF